MDAWAQGRGDTGNKYRVFIEKPARQTLQSGIENMCGLLAHRRVSLQPKDGLHYC